MKLTHYIFVRRDLPLGVLAAMITHAAGESAHLYSDDYDGRFRDAAAVVLEARNEAALRKVEVVLRANNFQYVVVEESHGEYAGQLMAIGLTPADRAVFGRTLEGFQTLKTCASCAQLDKVENEV